MSWQEAGGWVAAVIALISAVFVYGQLSQSVKQHQVDIQNLWAANSSQDRRINSHAERISWLEGKKRLADGDDES